MNVSKLRKRIITDVASPRTQGLHALKVCTVGNELPQDIRISGYLKDFGSEHPGLRILRLPLKNFKLESSAGVHQCLIFDLLGFTWTDVQKMYPDKVLNRNMLRGGLHMLLYGLDLLHQAGVVHTGKALQLLECDLN
jgi:hypothetical protein